MHQPLSYLSAALQQSVARWPDWARSRRARIAVHDMYGSSPAEMVPLFLILGLAGLPTSLSFSAAARRLNFAQLCLFGVVTNIGIFGLVSWDDFGSYVPYWALVIGFPLALQSWTSTTHNTLIALKVPPERQRDIAPLSQGLQQLARSIGPFFFTPIYGWARDVAAPRNFGPNILLAIVATVSLVTNLVPYCFLGYTYGSFRDPPVTPPAPPSGMVDIPPYPVRRLAGYGHGFLV